MAFSVVVGPAANSSESEPRRNTRSKRAPWKSPENKSHITTVHELLEDGVKNWGPRKFGGQRRFIKFHHLPTQVTKKVQGETVTTTKEWKFYELGEYSFVTFNELFQSVKTLGAGLVALGMVPGKDRFSVYSRTSLEWMQMALALSSQSLTIVTSYENLGPKGLESSLSETEAKGILSDPANLANILEAVEVAPGNLKFVIYRETDGPLSSSERETLGKLEKKGIKSYSFSGLQKLGEANPIGFTRPKPASDCCIMYTSGSTGTPKGVILSHENVVAGVAGITGICTFVRPSDVFLCVLPLAHIYEFTAELGNFVWGACMGYGSPKTLGDANMKNSPGDLRALRPSVMLGVPSLWELIRKGVLVKLEDQPPLAQKVFWGAFDVKIKLASWGLPMPLLDSLIFRKVRKASGGRLRALINGGANLSKDTRAFLGNVVAPLCMGYGITETNAMGSIMPLENVELVSAGHIVPSVTMKLVDVPEAGYYSRNGQGEIYMQGPSVSKGYFKNPEETAAAFTSDGWFRTGDIGEWTESGAVRIIDRRKNLIKTINGEYIALEYLESVYRSNKFVANICVVADDLHPKPVAVVVPYEPAVKHAVGEMGKSYSEESYSDPKVYKHILSSIQETGRSHGLAGFEIMPAITFSHEEWTNENGLATESLKLKRRAIRDEYVEGIEKAFQDTL